LQGLQGVPYPDEKLAQLSIESYANAIGVKATETNLVYRSVNDRKGNPFAVAVTADGTPILLAEKNQQTGEWAWQEITLRNLPDKIGFQFGAKVGFGDGDDSILAPYQDVLSREFGLITPQAAMTEAFMHSKAANRAISAMKGFIQGDENVDYWLSVSKKNNQTLLVHALFSKYLPTDRKLDTNDQVSSYLDDRIRAVLGYLTKYDRIGNTKLILANEPSYNGKVWDTSLPYYKTFGENWITEAYVRLWRIAKDEFHLIPGKDFQVIGINGLSESIKELKEWYVQQTVRIRQDIASRLVTPYDQIPFDLGLEYYFGSPASTINSPVPFDSFNNRDVTQIVAYLQDIQGRIKARLHLTEVAGNGRLEDVSKAFNLLTRAAIRSGVVDDLDFWQVLHSDRFDPTKTFPNPLIAQNYSRGLVYYSVLKGVLAEIAKTD